MLDADYGIDWQHGPQTSPAGTLYPKNGSDSNNQGQTEQSALVFLPLDMECVVFVNSPSTNDLLDLVSYCDLVGNVDPVHFAIRLLVPPGSLLLASGALDGRLGPGAEVEVVDGQGVHLLGGDRPVLAPFSIAESMARRAW